MTDTLRPAQPVEINTEIAYTGAITLPADTGASLRVVAFKGTQRISPHLGPTDATESGPIQMTTFGDSGESAVLTMPWETARILRDTLSTALRASDDRDYRDDKPRQTDY